MSNVVYRFFAVDGDLLYVGSTGRWPGRMGEHQSQRPWWGEVATVTLEHYASLDEARTAEARAIERERPAYTLPPATTGSLAWAARRAEAERLHALGKSCGASPCTRCRLRVLQDQYREQGHGDLVADVKELRRFGSGRWRVALEISRRLRLPLGVKGVSVGMVELIERMETAA